MSKLTYHSGGVGWQTRRDNGGLHPCVSCLSALVAANAQTTSADRMVAERMLRMGGSVIIEGQRNPVSDLSDLPRTDFQVRGLNFTGITQ